MGTWGPMGPYGPNLFCYGGDAYLTGRRHIIGTNLQFFLGLAALATAGEQLTMTSAQGRNYKASNSLSESWAKLRQARSGGKNEKGRGVSKTSPEAG